MTGNRTSQVTTESAILVIPAPCDRIKWGSVVYRIDINTDPRYPDLDLPIKLSLTNGETSIEFEPADAEEVGCALMRAAAIRRSAFSIKSATPAPPENVKDELLSSVEQYLLRGGLFNPEMALHDRVRDLIISLRDRILHGRCGRCTTAAKVTIPLGSYCLATKYSDGDCGDAWQVGFYAGETSPGRHTVADKEGNTWRRGGYRRCEIITREQGNALLDRAEAIELSGMKLWEYIHPSCATPHE